MLRLVARRYAKAAHCLSSAPPHDPIKGIADADSFARTWDLSTQPVGAAQHGHFVPLFLLPAWLVPGPTFPWLDGLAASFFVILFDR